MLVLFNKPYGVLCQFRSEDGRPDLSHYLPVPGIYPAGRLDRDSEGLLALTDDGRLQAGITRPGAGPGKSYWVQIEGIPESDALSALRAGLQLRDGPTRPARVRRIDPPAGLWPREPPIRSRLHIPTCWLEITLNEGRNRQVRRMTAAVGHPTLRLIRHRIGDWRLDGLQPGEWRRVPADQGPAPRRRRQRPA